MKESIMKKTSRRSFGRQITGALATLPLASLVTSPSASAQTSHDTPPPVLLMNGSVIVETAEADFDEKEIVSGQRKKYKRRPVGAGMKVSLAHIKVIDGSGEILYRGDCQTTCRDFSIAVTTAENDIINLASIANKFQIDTPSNKKLDKTTDPFDQPMSARRKGRFRYKDDSSGAQTSIKSVAVKQGGAGVFEVILDDLPDDGQELKVMMWLEERRS
jgi:hypothetical protein